MRPALIRCPIRRRVVARKLSSSRPNRRGPWKNCSSVRTGPRTAGVTGLKLGIFADSAGKPGEVLGQASFTGEPPTSSWIKASGLSTAVVRRDEVLARGAAAGCEHDRGSTTTSLPAVRRHGQLESVAGGLSTLTGRSPRGSPTTRAPSASRHSAHRPRANRASRSKERPSA